MQRLSESQIRVRSRLISEAFFCIGSLYAEPSELIDAVARHRLQRLHKSVWMRILSGEFFACEFALRRLQQKLPDYGLSAAWQNSIDDRVKSRLKSRDLLLEFDVANLREAISAIQSAEKLLLQSTADHEECYARAA
jgi:hypothetical protein